MQVVQRSFGWQIRVGSSDWSPEKNEKEESGMQRWSNSVMVLGSLGSVVARRVAGSRVGKKLKQVGK